MKRGIEILEGALAIGRQAEPLMPDLARSRMEAVKEAAKTRPEAAEKAVTASSVPDSPVLAKVKAWFTKKALGPVN